MRRGTETPWPDPDPVNRPQPTLGIIILPLLPVFQAPMFIFWWILASTDRMAGRHRRTHTHMRLLRHGSIVSCPAGRIFEQKDVCNQSRPFLAESTALRNSSPYTKQLTTSYKTVLIRYCDCTNGGFIKYGACLLSYTQLRNSNVTFILFPVW